MQQAEEDSGGLTGNVLKWIAIVSMVIDHIGFVLIETNYDEKGTFLERLPWSKEQILFADSILREIGRLAFPIFCFLLVQGAIYTRNRKKYALRLFLFSLISEVPFDLACYKTPFSIDGQNVFFTLFIGLLAICALDYWKEHSIKAWGMVAVLAVLAQVLRTDYGAGGVLLIVLFWVFRFEELRRNIVGAIWEVIGMGVQEAAAMFAFIPIHFYNGKRGKGNKYVFYVFYPVHLLILVWIRSLL